MSSHNPAWLINKHPKDLKAQIKELVERGYSVTVQDSTTAQLVYKKHFSCLLATISFFFLGIGFFIYLFYYLAQRDSIIYLDLETQELDPDWEKKEKEATHKRTIKTIIIVSIIVFGFLMLISLPSFLIEVSK
jgi:hypothetical protein